VKLKLTEVIWTEVSYPYHNQTWIKSRFHHCCRSYRSWRGDALSS